MDGLVCVTLRQRPELKQRAAAWFHAKWGVPEAAYLACMEAYLRASEVSRDRIDDLTKVYKEGDEVEAMIINIDRKTRSINLSIKAKDQAEQHEAMQKFSAESNVSSGTTNLGALLKAKLNSQQ